jgi:hypothetical protein
MFHKRYLWWGWVFRPSWKRNQLAEEAGQKKKADLKETKDFTGSSAKLWVQLGWVVGALLSLLVNNRGWSGYPAVSSPKEDICQHLALGGHRIRDLCSEWLQPMDTVRACLDCSGSSITVNVLWHTWRRPGAHTGSNSGLSAWGD